MSLAYPRVVIVFCTRCKWNLRAAWYLQELLSTFGAALGEVALQPGDSGVFKVSIVVDADAPPIELWDRKQRGGFPDSKELKQLVRDVIEPDRSLGHSDKSGGLVAGTASDSASAAGASGASGAGPSCENGGCS